MIDWSSGYTSTWRLMRVNPDTWEDAGIVDGVESIEISSDADGDLLDSCAVNLSGEPTEPFSEGWYRVEMLAEQGSQLELCTLGTFLMSSESGEVDKGVDMKTVYGSSVLRPVADREMPTGDFILEGADGAEYAASLLSECTPAPVETRGSFTLVSPVVFDAGCSYLDAVWQLLDAAGWCIQIDGRGNIVLMAKPEESSLLLDTVHASMLKPGIGREEDWTEVPNRYWAFDGMSIAVAVNDDPSSKTSVPSRGRYIDMVDKSPVRIGGETLQAYAERKLSEASVIKTEYSYTREYAEDVHPYSNITASMPTLGFDGLCRVSRQKLVCDKGVLVTESASREESTWPLA